MATTHEFSTIGTAALLDDLCQAVDLAREMAAGNTPWLNAIDKAWGYLLGQDTIAYDLSAHAIRVESATEPGRFYTANGECACEAFTRGAGVCWHRACARIVRRALELRPADEAEVTFLAAELLQEAAAAGEPSYTLEIAMAGARSRMPGLEAVAAEWDAAALAAKRSTLEAKIGAAWAARYAQAA
jgi:hypothetical protein